MIILKKVGLNVMNYKLTRDIENWRPPLNAKLDIWVNDITMNSEFISR